MEHNLSDLLRQLDALTKVFSNLSGQLSQANKELQDSFIPPSQELIEHLNSSRRQFEELCTRTLNLAKSFAVPSPKPEC